MTAAPPDWYPDPSGSGGLRYWDGQQWTGHLAPRPHHVPYGTPPGASASGPPSGASASYRAAPLAGVATTPDGARLAGWWHRVGATMLDQLLVVLLSVPFTVAVQVSAQPRMRDLLNELQRRVDERDPGVARWYFHQLFDLLHPYLWLYLGQSALTLLVITVCVRRWGGSPGQLLTGLRVRLRERPGRLSWGRAGLRTLLYPVLNTLAVAGCLLTGSVAATLIASGVMTVWMLLDPLWAAWDARKQTLHDKIVGTNVVRAR